MNVELRVAVQQQRAAALAQRVRDWLAPTRGDERALDAGCGAGAFAVAVAPQVGSVVGVDLDAALVAEAGRLAPANASFLVGDAVALPFPPGSFDLAGCLRVLHHVRRPELVVAELARVTGPGSRILVVDQLGATDPLVSLELDRFERARDPSHGRLLPDGDVRALLEANGLTVVRNEVVREARELEPYLDLAGCTGEARERARALAPAERYEVEVGWYLARRP